MTLAMDRPISLDDDVLADKKRFESFKLGGGAPPFNTVPAKRLSHGRSHSRNGSVSLSFSATAPVPIPAPAPAPTAPEQRHHASNSSVSTSRSSHHRRRSSVSTRRESAEMMGVALPELPPALSELNINLGDKDSVRRRALWALESKPNSDTVNTVEIPELTAPEIERRIFELPSKPSYPLGSGFSSGLSGLAGKRDSFGNHFAPSASNKDQLHTLVEEEEEEEEEEPTQHLPTTQDSELTHGAVTATTPTGKPRPAGLNLRPLSLTPDTIAFNPEVPGHSPSARCPAGLKALTLVSSPSPAPTNKRQSFTGPSSSHRSSLTYRTDSMSSASSDDMPRKRSSISYKPQVATSSLFGLPTPEATPTSERRGSLEFDSEQSFLSRGGEPSFLAQSHAALLTRVGDLERALKERSRPQSLQSDISASEPSDELLELIMDLKAERDELKKDCCGWRTRVADLEKQTGVLAKRVDVERREAWVSRERVGLLEMEKRAIAKQAEEFKDAADALQMKVDALTRELATSQQILEARQMEVKRGEEAVMEVASLRKMLSEETCRREFLERELEGAGLLNTPVPAQSFAPRIVKQNRWQSFGSESSTTDVESVDGLVIKGLGLNAVAEEDEDVFSDEEDGLEGYEDEADGDFNDSMTASSTYSSFRDAPRGTSLESQAPPPTHSRNASLVRSWAFPAKGAPLPSAPQVEEVDRFFGCLEDLEDSPPLDYAPAIRAGNPFSLPSVNDEDDFPPFFIPSDVGVEVIDSSAAMLDKITEEEEEEYEEGNSYEATDDEFVGEVDEGGIKFTFTVPPEFNIPESPASPSPSLTSTIIATPPPPANITPLVMDDEDLTVIYSIPETPVKALPRSSFASPSSIPRAISQKKIASPPSPSISSLSSSPSKMARPSLIPQPVRSTKPSFVPQPHRTSAQQQRPTRILSPVSTRPHGDAPPSRLPSKIPSSPTSRSPVVSAALSSLAGLVPRMPWSSTPHIDGQSAADNWGCSSVADSSTSSGFMSLFGGGGGGGGERQEKRGYVSKERQLVRLRGRLEEERQGIYVMPDICKRCEKEDMII